MILDDKPLKKILTNCPMTKTRETYSPMILQSGQKTRIFMQCLNREIFWFDVVRPSNFQIFVILFYLYLKLAQDSLKWKDLPEFLGY